MTIIRLFFALCLLFPLVGFGQSVGMFSSMTQYRQSGPLSYENAENRLASDFGMHYHRTLSNRFSLRVGFSQTRRVSEHDFGFARGKAHEDFANIPVLLEMSSPISGKTQFVIGAGANAAAIMKQRLLFPSGVVAPSDFQSEYDAASYWKFGLLASMGFIQGISERSAFFVMASSQFEFEDLALNRSGNPAFFYQSFSLSLGMQFRLRQ